MSVSGRASRFPLKSPHLLEKWIAAVKRPNFVPTVNSVLCSEHFDATCFRPTPKRNTLTCNAVPTLLFHDKGPELPTARRRLVRGPIHEMPLLPMPHKPKIIDKVPKNKSNGKPPLKVELEHSYTTPSTSECISELKMKNIELKKTVNRQKQKIHRLKIKVTKYEEIIQGLRDRLCETGKLLVEKCFQDTLKNLIKESESGTAHPHSYPQEVRTFALTLHFYSSKAYEYLRNFINLPAPRTLREWAMAVDGEPGFCEASFKLLDSIVEEKGRAIRVCLIFDEMSIKKGLSWDGQKSVGFVNLGHGDIDFEDGDFATEALVFMVTSVDDVDKTWKLPIGYSLIKGLSCALKINLIHQYLQKTYDHHVIVVALSCDGLSTNKLSLKELGVTLTPSNIDEGQSFFPHPSDSSLRIYCFLDAAHMLKLFRNLLGEKSYLIQERLGKDEVISWEYLVLLLEIQEEEGLHAANSLRRRHLDYHQQKMNVSMAAQTLSNSVANALLFCRNLGLEEFEDCDETIFFLKMIDTAFDIQNSCNFARGPKSPITATSADYHRRKISECIDYFKTLRLIDGTPLLLSQRSTAVFGFILNLKSILGLAEDLIWNTEPSMEYLLTRRFSQDHLELFFSTIRSRGGHSNNPTAAEFRCAFRKSLVARVDEALNKNSNVKPDNTQMIPVATGSAHVTEEEEFTERVLNINPHLNDPFIYEPQPLSVFAKGIVEYMAGYTVFALEEKMICDKCREIMMKPGPDKQGLILAKDNKDGLKNPSIPLVKLCERGEQVFRTHDALDFSCADIMDTLIEETRKFARTEGFFEHEQHLSTSTAASHFEDFTKFFLSRFFTSRINGFLQSESEAKRGRIIRQRLTKAIIFSGQ